MGTIFRLHTERTQWKDLIKRLLLIFVLALAWFAITEYAVMVGTLVQFVVYLVIFSAASYFISITLLTSRRLFGLRWFPKTFGFGFLFGIISFYIISYGLHFHNLAFSISESLFIGQVLGIVILANAFSLIFFPAWFLFNTEVDNIGWFLNPLGLSSGLMIIWHGFTQGGSLTFYVVVIFTLALLYYSAWYYHTKPRLLHFYSRFFSTTLVLFVFLIIGFLLTYTGEPLFSAYVVNLSWILIINYILLVIYRWGTEKRFSLFENSEHLHLRLTGSLLITGLVFALATRYGLIHMLSMDVIDNILYSFFILLTGILITTYFISRRVTAPLQQFLEGLQHITSGALNTIIPIQSKDEVGELAHAFNMMVYRLQDLQNELASTERQAAFSEMARQVAHEIKNPLTPMKLKVQHLQRSFTSGKTATELTPLVKTVTAELIEQIESLNTIARSFSKYAKPITSEFQEADLNKLIDDTLTLYKHEDKVKILVDHADNPLLCTVAVDEWKRIIINLVNNSSEAMPNGGVIIIRLYPHNGRGYVEVVDNGEGIAVEDKPKIFTPNFSTKSSGTGLGLAITKKLVEAMEGDIQFASAKGAGTTFTLSFPLV